MRKNLKSKVTLSIITGAFIFGSSVNNFVLAGENKVINTDLGTENVYALDKSNVAEGIVSGGKVTVEAGGVAGDVYAAVTGGADAVGNHAVMSDGKVNYLAGAATDYGDGELEFSSNGATKENTVTINGGTVQEAVGGESFGTGVAENNSVTVTGGEVDNAYGASVENGIASGNKVVITGGKVTGSGNDGYVDDGDLAQGERTENLGAYGAISYGTGALIGNSVEISGDAQVSNAFGGYSDGVADVKNNSVSLTGTAQIGAVDGVVGNAYNGIVVGGYTSEGNAEGNRVHIAGYKPVTKDDFDTLGELSQQTSSDGLKTIAGGVAVTKGNVSGNSVAISDSVFVITNSEDDDENIKKLGVTGGYSNNGKVANNTVTVNNIITNATLTGGSAVNGTVESNKVIIKGDNEFITGDGNKIYGGYHEGTVGLVSCNTVDITGNLTFTSLENTTDKDIIFGGYAENVGVVGNVVKIADDAVISSNNDIDVYGGYAVNGKAEKNQVIVDGNADLHDVYGGVTGGGYDAVGNIAVINGGSADYLAGGATDYGNEENVNGAALNNKVYVQGGTVKEVAGGEAFGTGVVKGNEVYMTAGTVQNIYGGNTYLAAAEGNKVVITGGQVTGSGSNGYTEQGDAEDPDRVTKNLGVYGAISTIDPDSSNPSAAMGELRNNTVEISGNAQVSNVFGAYSDGTSNVTGNTVTITGKAKVGKLVDGNEYDGRVYGGYSKNGDVTGNIVNISEDAVIEGNIYGGYSETGKVTGNKVIINGTVTGDIYGGYYGTGSATTFAGEKSADQYGNLVEIHSDANLEGANIYGSNVEGNNDKIIIGSGKGSDSWSGSINSIKNVSEVQFANVKYEEGKAILTVNDASGIKNTKFNANGVNFDVQNGFEVGNTVQFVNDEAGVSQENIEVGNYTQGTFYEGTLKKNADGSVAVATKAISDQTDIVGENRAVAAAFVNQGTDLINDSLDSLSRANEYGVKTFASVYGNRSQYDIGRDMKINGWSSIVGVGTEKELNDGSFIWGVFYENGDGNYRFENSNINGSFRGDGSTVYNGGGILARYEKDNGVYTEASLRAGTLKNEMSNALEAGGKFHSYKTENAYYGAHLGIGKFIELNDTNSVDVYGKFFHTYNESDSFTLGTNETYELGSVTSDRLRIGARIINNKANKVSTYYGLAYEYEFDGEASGTLKDNALRAESLQGSSYIAEVGVNYKPSAESPWSFDLSMHGYAGEREGFSGSMQAVYAF